MGVISQATSLRKCAQGGCQIYLFIRHLYVLLSVDQFEGIPTLYSLVNNMTIDVW